VKIYTIGVNKKGAEEFFNILKQAGVEKVLDLRLNNKSQLLGFSKGKDLKYFCEHCHNIKYEHIPLLAPTQELIKNYRAHKDWPGYEKSFREILESRPALDIFTKASENFNAVCLLCTEVKPDKCHRRLVAEYIANKMNNIAVIHL